MNGYLKGLLKAIRPQLERLRDCGCEGQMDPSYGKRRTKRFVIESDSENVVINDD